jgi:two-component system phosphate regulon sensor histidine kinase PhoR
VPRSIAGRLFLGATLALLISLAAAITVLRMALPVDLASSVRGAIVVATIAGAAVAFAVAYVLARTISRPMQGLARHAREGRIETWIDPDAPSEVAELGATLARVSADVRRLEAVRQEFVANVSHELRTPISSLKAMVEALEAGAIHEPAVARDFVRRMHSEVDDLAQLVSELLTLSRVESGQDEPHLESIAPEALIGRAVARLRPLAERASVRLESVPVAPLPPVRADPEKVGQVLANLVHNAIKFTPAGGSVEVSAQRGTAAVRFEVTDSGVGIAPEEVERVFERFFKGERSRAGGGTGLGLAIAKHIVQAHGGAIDVRSDGPGRGSTFGFTLPIFR